MEVEPEFSVDLIVQTSLTYFPFITEKNFHEIFKLTPKQISAHLISTSKNTVRDFLILLHWCKHANSLRYLAVIFNLKKSRVGVILTEQLNFWSDKITDIINMKEMKQVHDEFFLKNCIGSVDGTEFQINSWIGDSYSGKQGYFQHYFYFFFIIFCINIFLIFIIIFFDYYYYVINEKKKIVCVEMFCLFFHIFPLTTS
jgi:hypothetical protein